MACWTNFVTGQLECDPSTVAGSGVLDNETYQNAVAQQVYAPVVTTKSNSWILLVAGALGFGALTYYLSRKR